MGKTLSKIKAVAKREAGYLGKGAKVIGKAAGNVVKEKIADAKATAAANREAARLAKVAEQEAYKEELRVQLAAKAQERGKARAQRAAQGGGSSIRNTFTELGQIGLRLEGHDAIGLGALAGAQKQPQINSGKVQAVGSYLLDGMGATGSPSNYIMSGIGNPRSNQQQRRHGRRHRNRRHRRHRY